MFVLLAACAQVPGEAPPQRPAPEPLPPLPVTLVNDPDCPGCLGVTLTLRPDGAYLVREQLGAAEFYDFGRWRYTDGTLELAGDRATRRYPLANFRKSPTVEPLRGPFRLVGVYDGKLFKECRTGLSWQLADTRAASVLREEISKRKTSLVALDAQFEDVPERLRVLRPASVLDARSCPS